MRKIKGKNGFYPKVQWGGYTIYHLYNHKKALFDYNNSNRRYVVTNNLVATVDDRVGEYIIYSKREREFLIVEGGLSNLLIAGKKIRNEMYLNEVIDTLFKYKLLNGNMKWSRLESHLLDTDNPLNWQLHYLSLS